MAQSASLSHAPRRLWILGPWQDWLLFIGTPALILPLVWLARTRVRIEDLAFFVAAFGALGHHFPGLLRAYGDPELFQRFKVRFVVAPLFLVAVCVFCVSQELTGLTLVLYAWGVWHGLAQTYGFLRIYDAKVLSSATLTCRLDLAMCVAWFGGLVVLSPTRCTACSRCSMRAEGPSCPPRGSQGARVVAQVALVGVTLAFLVHLLVGWQSRSKTEPAQAPDHADQLRLLVVLQHRGLEPAAGHPPVRGLPRRAVPEHRLGFQPESRREGRLERPQPLPVPPARRADLWLRRPRVRLRHAQLCREWPAERAAEEGAAGRARGLGSVALLLRWLHLEGARQGHAPIAGYLGRQGGQGGGAAPGRAHACIPVAPLPDPARRTRGSRKPVAWRPISSAVGPSLEGIGAATDYHQLGQSLLAAGDRPAAVESFRAALERDPTLAPARAGLGGRALVPGGSGGGGGGLSPCAPRRGPGHRAQWSRQSPGPRGTGAGSDRRVSTRHRARSRAAHRARQPRRRAGQSRTVGRGPGTTALRGEPVPGVSRRLRPSTGTWREP